MNIIGTISDNNGHLENISDYDQIINGIYLFNAGKTTNFTFMITCHDFSNSEIENINAINTRTKLIDRVTEIQKIGGEFKFKTMDDSICRNNFILIDSYLPSIMASILLEGNKGGSKDLKSSDRNNCLKKSDGI